MIKSKIYSKHPADSELDFIALDCHLWPEEYPFFVSSEVAICAVEDVGLCVSFIAKEPSPRAVFKHRDDPVCNDSCMEFFFQPFADDNRYLNFEINPNAACLCAIGNDRYDRIFLKEISCVEPIVSAEIFQQEWSAKLTVPEQLISDAFGRDFCVSQLNFIRANFYKCGDQTAAAHYSSLFPVDTVQPDFHRSEFFQKIYFQHERK
ncbi:MAG: carbohydrate-binding family 9-like protein [Clostridia bacterium]|nr:carbohydrate-binding family 9-like protein [Clostridia bacterium]